MYISKLFFTHVKLNKMIKIPKKPKNLKKFFSDLGFGFVFDSADKVENRFKDRRLSIKPYPPDLLDLYYLYELININIIFIIIKLKVKIKE